MLTHNCPTCQCKPDAPSYPVMCVQCGQVYGPDEEVKTHRPGSQACVDRIVKRAKANQGTKTIAEEKH